MTAGGVGARAEAHLWLLLEEALVDARRDGIDVWEVQRRFRHVCDALLAAGVASPSITTALRYELDDALVVRGLLPPASFTAFGVERRGAMIEAADEPVTIPVIADGSIWLEAELERHLDLLASHDPIRTPGAGAEALRILAAPVRALEAAGVLGSAGRALLADFAASIGAAGFDLGQVPVDGGRVRREWVRFLRDRPAPWRDGDEHDETRSPFVVLGTLRDRTVRVDGLAWSADELVVHLTVRPPGPDGFGAEDTVAWSLRALDDRGRLHVGQPVPPIAGLRYRLRPGLPPGARRLDLRLTARGARVEGSVDL